MIECSQMLYRPPYTLYTTVQGDLWKQRIKDCQAKLVLPLTIFFDEYETNNPSGFHKGRKKCGKLYVKKTASSFRISVKIR